jgi:hypothetical protein
VADAAATRGVATVPLTVGDIDSAHVDSADGVVAGCWTPGDVPLGGKRTRRMSGQRSPIEIAQYRRDNVIMSSEERPLTRRGRIIVVALVWIVGVPFMIVLWYWFSWVSLLLMAAAVWTSYDYIRKGDMARHVTDAASSPGYYVPEGTIKTFGHEQKD